MGSKQSKSGNTNLDLPSDTLIVVFKFLDFRSANSIRVVSKTWNSIICDNDKRHKVPKSGLHIWLDASEYTSFTFSEEYKSKLTTPVGYGIKEWRSIVGKQSITPFPLACKGRDNTPTHEIGDPVYVHSCINDRPAVFFDYGHSGRFKEPLKAKTVITVHSFEVKGRVTHFLIHKYHDDICNFYIFTDSEFFYMHSNTETAANNLSHSTCAHPSFRQGTIRINGKDSVPVAEVSRWTDDGFRLALLSLNRPIINGLSRIGSDRHCHQYCGSIAEMLVFDRDLTTNEIDFIESYLLQKYNLG